MTDQAVDYFMMTVYFIHEVQYLQEQGVLTICRMRTGHNLDSEIKTTIKQF